jgi:CubicO group peptidase (beta-lactamase class C family)
LFTWTAIMQLYEQGKLDLDRDVNEYLDYKIPDAFGKPITLKNIMTHTPGFEEQIKDLFTVGNSKPVLGEYLKTHIPGRVYPPGTVPAYSNYATAVAGYIVERVSGRPFDEYVAENILKPLKMTRSTFSQPLPSELAPLMSNGYRLGSGSAEAFEVVNPYPAGSLSSSATDMAQFMIAHLQDGQLGDARILKPETARLMHSRLTTLPTRCVTDSTKNQKTGSESSGTAATPSTFTAICISCWTRSLAFLFPTTVLEMAAVEDWLFGRRFSIVTIRTRHPRPLLRVRKTTPKQRQAPIP